MGASALCCAVTTPDLQPTDPYALERDRMVETQIVARGVKDRRVLDAMRRVPRHELVSEASRDAAYEDRPLVIGYGQTISQPYIVAFMTEMLHLSGSERVLEVGTGSGYQAAVLAELCKEVYSIEIVEALANRARADLERLGYRNVQIRHGDGYRGWPEAAPFDAIIVTAAPDHVPTPLASQLAVGGRMILPLGNGGQELVLLRKTESGLEREVSLPVRFVPMTGEAMKPREP